MRSISESSSLATLKLGTASAPRNKGGRHSRLYHDHFVGAIINQAQPASKQSPPKIGTNRKRFLTPNESMHSMTWNHFLVWLAIALWSDTALASNLQDVAASPERYEGRHIQL